MAAHPAANLAIATGYPGADVLDVDQHGPAGSGFAAFSWLKRAGLADGPQITRELIGQYIGEELAKIAAAYGDAYDPGQFDVAVALFKEVALADEYDEFLTLPAYDRMP